MSSSRSKSTTKKKLFKYQYPKDLVFIKGEGDKHNIRELYLVTDANHNDLTVCKISGTFSGHPASMQPHNFSYRIKRMDAYIALASIQPTVLEVKSDFHPEVINLELPQEDFKPTNRVHSFQPDGHT